MKSLFKLSAILCVMIFSSSCEDVVQIKLDEGSKLYVIDAFVNDNREDQVIRIHTNDSYFSNREAPPVLNASVVLKDLSTDKQFTFDHTSNGNYVYQVSGSDTIARVNHQYELNVTIEGVTYTSLTTQKRTAGIDSIGAEFFDGNSGFGPPGQAYYLCFLYAKDKVDEMTDYYWVKTFRNDSLLFRSQDINISIDGTNGPVSGIPVDSTDFTPPITFIGFKQYQKGNTCKVEIHSIAKETYYFFIQASQQINNSGLFATTPENVKTNIVTPRDAATKAIGWFNMATVASKKITIP